MTDERETIERAEEAEREPEPAEAAEHDDLAEEAEAAATDQADSESPSSRAPWAAMQVEDIKQRAWDFGLTVATVVLLGAIGVQSFVGTLYVWWAQRTIPNWEAIYYTDYVAMMNAIAAPLLIALVVVMGLCVPKRLFSRTTLIWVSMAMVIAGLVATLVLQSLALGVAVYLGLAALIQIAVVVMTLAGVRGPSYLTEGRLVKTGSGLLHLGFIVFGIVVAALQNSAFMLPVFWVSAVLMGGGTAMSFYANRLSFRRHPESMREHSIEL